jgi:ABC-type multidrug transport system ATPase subunit
VVANKDENAIKAALLKKKYSKNGKDVLQSLTFGVERGKILGIIGPVHL